MSANFIDIADYSSAALRDILLLAHKMKSGAISPTPLLGKTIAMIFEKSSTRTRISFEVGIKQLGGTPLVLNSSDMQLSRGETIGDTAQVLSRYVDAVMIRALSHETVLQLTENADIPVINGLTNLSHPCQIMADIMTFEEKKGSIKGKKVVWFGDSNNVFNSFLQAAEKFNFSLIFSGPKELDPPKNLIKNAKNLKIDFKIDRDPISAIKDADVVATDTWVSMHDNPEEKQNRHNQLKAFQVNEELMSKANHEALFMHCLPAHRNEEATSGVLDGKNSVIFDEAENRLHVQKAIMRWCLSK